MNRNRSVSSDLLPPLFFALALGLAAGCGPDTVSAHSPLGKAAAFKKKKKKKAAAGPGAASAGTEPWAGYPLLEFAGDKTDEDGDDEEQAEPEFVVLDAEAAVGIASQRITIRRALEADCKDPCRLDDEDGPSRGCVSCRQGQAVVITLSRFPKAAIEAELSELVGDVDDPEAVWQVTTHLGPAPATDHDVVKDAIVKWAQLPRAHKLGKPVDNDEQMERARTSRIITDRMYTLIGLDGDRLELSVEVEGGPPDAVPLMPFVDGDITPRGQQFAPQLVQFAAGKKPCNPEVPDGFQCRLTAAPYFRNSTKGDADYFEDSWEVMIPFPVPQWGDQDPALVPWFAQLEEAHTWPEDHTVGVEVHFIWRRCLDADECG